MGNDGQSGTSEILHASCVALGPRGLLILGGSGSGKSALGLELMAYGAALVADDRTRVTLQDGALWADCPPAIRGRIEARGIGILAADTVPGAAVAAAVDLDRDEAERLPPERTIAFLGREIPLILRAPGLSLAPALLQYLKGSRCA